MNTLTDVIPPEVVAQVAENADPVSTLVLEGEICEREVRDVCQMVDRLWMRGVRQLVIDFTEVNHFDYRGVKPLLTRAGKLRSDGGDLKLCGLSPYIHAIFRSAGAHASFEYLATKEEARASFTPAFFASGS